jgi:hypothetical protein
LGLPAEIQRYLAPDWMNFGPGSVKVLAAPPEDTRGSLFFREKHPWMTNFTHNLANLAIFANIWLIFTNKRYSLTRQDKFSNKSNGN